MFDLSGKTALVTGASGGIGGAIAKVLHGAGAQVTLAGTRADALHALAGELKDRAHVATADLGDAASLDALVKSAESAMGKVDILVNNAGVTRDTLLMRMKDEDWQTVIDVNLTATFRLSRAVLRSMMKNRWGRIISITSIVGVTGNRGAGQLCRIEGRHDRPDQVAGRRGRQPGHHRELHRARLHHHADDRRAERGAEDPSDGRHSRRPFRGAGRYRGRRALSGKRGGFLRDRPDLACEWRNGHDIAARGGSVGALRLLAGETGNALGSMLGNRTFLTPGPASGNCAGTVHGPEIERPNLLQCK